MRFFRIMILVFMLTFAFNTFAATTHTALKVSTTTKFTGMSSGKVGASSNSSSSLGKWGAAAGGVAVLGALAATGVGLPLALIAGLTMYNKLSPSKCSFDTILNNFKSLSDGSWLSPIFNILFNASNQLTTNVNDRLGGTVVTILTILLAFYLLFTATKYIVSLSPIEPAKFLSEIFFPLGRCIIAVWAIKNWDFILKDILSPILQLAIEFGSEMMNSMSSSTGGSQTGVEIVQGTCIKEVDGAGLSVGVCSSIQTFLGTMASSLLVWMAFGATLLTDCWGQGWLGILPSFKMLILGILFLVFTFLVYVSFPIKLIDTMFRLMFVTVLFPLWCMFWVIPQTRQYCKKMVELLINVMATFLSASIILVMVISILSNLFEGIPLKEILKLLQAGKAEQAMDKIGFSTSGLFFSMCLLFMAFHLVGKVDYFANLFAKFDDMKIGSSVGGAATAAIAASPKLYGMGKNATKWGAGKVKGGLERAKAKMYNGNVPGGTARKSPRLFTAPIPFIGAWDAHQAKKAIGTFAQTKDVSVSGVEVNPDGSKSRTYSNRTVDKDGNTLAQMKETTTSSKDKVNVGGKKVRAAQSVERQTTRFDQAGDVRKTTGIKKDFEKGQAVRKTTTMTDKNGNKVVMSVDKATGKRTKTTYNPDNTIKSISEETRDSSGNRYTTVRDASGKLMSRQTMDKKGNLDKTTFEADGTTIKNTSTIRIDATTGNRTSTYSEPSGFRKETIQDKDNVNIKETTHYAGGGERVDDFKPKGPDGKTPGFIRQEKDSSGNITEHWDVDTVRDEFYDIRGGGRTKMTEKWSVYSARRP